MSHDALKVGAGYLQRAFADADSLVADAQAELEGIEFDTMIGTGLSGAIVAPLLARAMGKHFAIVRKDKDGSHSTAKAEGHIGRRWVFVDDLLDTGSTLERVCKTVPEAIGKSWNRDWQTEFAGAYFYDQFGAPEFRSVEHCERYLPKPDSNPCAAMVSKPTPAFDFSAFLRKTPSSKPVTFTID